MGMEFIISFFGSGNGIYSVINLNLNFNVCFNGVGGVLNNFVMEVV